MQDISNMIKSVVIVHCYKQNPFIVNSLISFQIILESIKNFLICKDHSNQNTGRMTQDAKISKIWQYSCAAFQKFSLYMKLYKPSTCNTFRLTSIKRLFHHTKTFNFIFYLIVKLQMLVSNEKMWFHTLPLLYHW